MVYDGREGHGPATWAEIKGCAVAVLHQHPHERSDGELLELVKEMLVRRKLTWRYSEDLARALKQAGRYQVLPRCQGIQG